MVMNEKFLHDYLDVLDEICQSHGCAYRMSREIDYRCHTNSITIEFDGPRVHPVRNLYGQLVYDDCGCATYPSIIISGTYFGTLYDLIVYTRNFFSRTLRIEETEYTKHFWEELLMKNFTKKDLKNGDFVILRNGKVGIVIADTEEVVYDGGGFDNLLSWNEELTSKTHASYNPRLNPYDIMKVCRNVHTFDGAKSAVGDRIVYDRERETVEEMTLEQVCKALGKNIKIVKG